MSQNSHDSSETPQQLVHERVSHELLARDLEVAAVTQLTPRMIRVTFSGDSLASFKSLGPADHVKAFFPDPETGEYHAPRMTAAGMQRSERRKARWLDYTPLPPDRAVRASRHGAPTCTSWWATNLRSRPSAAGCSTSDRTATSRFSWRSTAPKTRTIRFPTAMPSRGCTATALLRELPTFLMRRCAGSTFPPTPPVSCGARARPAA